MIVLVAVQEADDFGLRAKEHVAIEPAERERVPARRARLDALGAIGDALAERPERLGNLYSDSLGIIFAQSRQMRTCAVAQGFDLQPVAFRPRQVGQHSAHASGWEAVKSGMHLHVNRTIRRLCQLIPVVCASLLALTALLGGAPAAAAERLIVERRSVIVDGKAFAVELARAPLSAYRLKVSLARGRVGATEPLASIALRASAEAAINGCFFDAYTRETIKPPYHHIVTGGMLVHTGNTGTTLGFDGAGRYRMERVRISLLGGLDGGWRHPNNWYAYFMNHPVESSNAAVIYTSHWAAKTTPAAGLQVVVRGGVVRGVGTGGQTIPADGYVLALTGRERYLARRFAVGRQAAYRLVIGAQDPG
ncbi:MAG: hypothetical protein ACRDGN_06010, partial [bacterium]